MRWRPGLGPWREGKGLCRVLTAKADTRQLACSGLIYLGSGAEREEPRPRDRRSATHLYRSVSREPYQAGAWDGDTRSHTTHLGLDLPGVGMHNQNHRVL